MSHFFMDFELFLIYSHFSHQQYKQLFSGQNCFMWQIFKVFHKEFIEICEKEILRYHFGHFCSENPNYHLGLFCSELLNRTKNLSTLPEWNSCQTTLKTSTFATHQRPDYESSKFWKVRAYKRGPINSNMKFLLQSNFLTGVISVLVFCIAINLC